MPFEDLDEPVVPSGTRDQENRIALVIGNARYKIGRKLKNAVRDAQAVAHAFERLNFTVITKRDLGVSAMGRALADFGSTAQDADFAVIYFAGHGLEIDGESYLVPVDARLTHINHVPFETITLSEVLGTVGSAKILRLVILDACREDPFRNNMRGLEATRSIGGGLAIVEPPVDTLVAYSAKHGTLASDGEPGSTNGPYVRALLDHIETPNLDIMMVFRKVRDGVLTLTDNVQTPHLYGHLGGDEIYLNESGSQPTTAIAHQTETKTPIPSENWFGRLLNTKVAVALLFAAVVLPIMLFALVPDLNPENTQLKNEQQYTWALEQEEDPVPKAWPILQLLARGLGNHDYNYYIYKEDSEDHPSLTQMTIDEVTDWQAKRLDNWNSLPVSRKYKNKTATVGRYLITKDTINNILRYETGLTRDSYFSVTTQDTLAFFIVYERGMTDWLNGKLTDEEFAERLARTWNAFPVFSEMRGQFQNVVPGESFWKRSDRNLQVIPRKDVMDALAKLKKSYLSQP